MTVMVKMRHVRSLNLCSRGTRAWFAKYELSFDEFVTNGLPVEVIEGTGDDFGLRVAQIAREDNQQ